MREVFGAPEWDRWVTGLPGGHILQTCAWADVKARVGWLPRRFVWEGMDGSIQAAAQVLRRDMRFGPARLPVSVTYIPKGPLLDWQNAALRHQVLDDLQRYARQQRAIFLKIDPDIWLGSGIPGETDAREFQTGLKIQGELQSRGWQFSQDQIQFRNTVWIDLTEDEDTLLARMKQKTRYNLHLAERKGVFVRPGDQSDLPLLFQMYVETSIRDGFIIRDQEYYRFVWDTFMQAGIAEPLIAEVDGEPIAGIIVFRLGDKAWYLYGMSRQVHREKMPNGLLQWEAIRRAKAAGCSIYDLWGAPDEFSEKDPMWGVFRFKEGLGGHVMRGLGAWDYPVSLPVYTLYTKTLPQILNIMRMRGKTRIKQALNSIN